MNSLSEPTMPTTEPSWMPSPAARPAGMSSTPDPIEEEEWRFFLKNNIFFNRNYRNIV
uniref:Uncharacterized protein n=1 Tax=Arundo donax TaxID=35708 RepID=A0A0A9AC40_ARUDO